MATLLPGEKGLALIDLVPGATTRILNPPDRAVLSVVGDAPGRRLVTIEQVLDDPFSAGMEGMSSPDSFFNHNEYQVILWDPEHLDEPIAKLQWTRPGPAGRQPRPSWPLVSISRDGKTVAVAGIRGKFVRLFSGVDGGRAEERDEIDTQSELGALALGPNELLATAGTTSGGGVIKVWDLDTRANPTILTPPTQSYTSLMRFSPQGTVLAIAGVGPIELWDPVAHSLVAVLQMDDQATDLAFAADGRTLAATGHSSLTSVWTVHDSVARTQLSGFDSPQSSLAFNQDGCGWREHVAMAISGSGAVDDALRSARRCRSRSRWPARRFRRSAGPSRRAAAPREKVKVTATESVPGRCIASGPPRRSPMTLRAGCSPTTRTACGSGPRALLRLRRRRSSSVIRNCRSGCG